MAEMSDWLVDVRTADELAQRARRRRKRFADGGDEVGPEPGRIRVGVLDLQPGEGLRALGQPRCQQRRLAGTGRCAGKHQPDLAGEAGIEPIGESRPLHEPIGQRRWHQLRRCQSAVPVPGHGFDPTSSAKCSARHDRSHPGEMTDRTRRPGTGGRESGVMPEPTTYEIVLRGRPSRRLLRPLLDDFTIDASSECGA